MNSQIIFIIYYLSGVLFFILLTKVESGKVTVGDLTIGIIAAWLFGPLWLVVALATWVYRNLDKKLF